PSTTVRCAVAPTSSASWRSTGVAAARTRGATAAARRVTAYPSRTRPSGRRPTYPWDSSVPNNRYAAVRLIRRLAASAVTVMPAVFSGRASRSSRRRPRSRVSENEPRSSGPGSAPTARSAPTTSYDDVGRGDLVVQRLSLVVPERPEQIEENDDGPH